MLFVMAFCVWIWLCWVGVLVANTGNRLNGRVQILSGRGKRRTCFFASIRRLSVYSRRTIREFIGNGQVSIVIGYTTCATISGTRSGRRLYSGLGRITPNCLTTTTRTYNTTLVRISASCIFSKAKRAPCARRTSAYPGSMCNSAGLTNRRTIVGRYDHTVVVHAT